MTAAEPLSAEELADIRECVAADKANQLVSAQWLTAHVARLLAAYDAVVAERDRLRAEVKRLEAEAWEGLEART